MGANQVDIVEEIGEELDMIEHLRRQSIDLRINPVGMRRILFKVQTTFKEAREQACSEAAKKNEGDEESNAVSSALATGHLECAICLINFEDQDQVVPLNCNDEHIFHLDCLLNWADHNYTCPICRQPII